MSRTSPFLGLAALLALAALAPRRARLQPAPPAPLHAMKAKTPASVQAPRPATPRRARVDVKHDAPIQEARSPTVWVLVQTEPRFAVLATADNAQRLKDEVAVLEEMFDERNEQHRHRWEVRATKPLFV